jgi:WD40 repeat protein
MPDGDDSKPVLPPGSFITCSSDDTIRIWNLSTNMSTNTIYRRNIYSEDLIKTLYIDSDLNHIKEKPADAAAVSNGDGAGGKDGKEQQAVYDQRNGVRCIRISPDGRHLASGDRAGNIRVHELQFMDELCKIEAHDAEVLCLEYCMASKKQQAARTGKPRKRYIYTATKRQKSQNVIGLNSLTLAE